MNLVCLNCNARVFQVMLCEFTPQVQGKEVTVSSYAYVCLACQTPLMDGDQMNELRKKALEKYQSLDRLIGSRFVTLD